MARAIATAVLGILVATIIDRFLGIDSGFSIAWFVHRVMYMVLGVIIILAAAKGRKSKKRAA